MMFQVRDDEDPESRAGRLARDRDHHAQVIKKVSKIMTLPMFFVNADLANMGDK